MSSRALDREEGGQYSLNSSLKYFWENKKIGHILPYLKVNRLNIQKLGSFPSLMLRCFPEYCVFLVSCIHFFFFLVWSDSFPQFHRTHEQVYFIPSSLIILTIFILFWDMAHTVVQTCRALTMYWSQSVLNHTAVFLPQPHKFFNKRYEQPNLDSFSFLTLFLRLLSFFSSHPKFGISYLSFGSVLCSYSTYL